MVNAHPIADDVRYEILRRLRAAEKEHQIQILYACESGSRAWGFASTDSDYDVRFIYVNEPSWYLAFDVESKRDVVEYPIVDEIDCNGWNIKKALYLFTRTNGALFEWLHSPIVYIEQGTMASELRTQAEASMNPTALCYHYSHMARTNARGYLLADQVKLKKYFYVLRPLLAIRYIEANLGIPPVEFERLLETVGLDSIKNPVRELLEKKRNMPEVGVGPPVAEIQSFIESELERHGDQFSGQVRPDLLDKQELRDQLNVIFRNCISN